MTYKIQHYDADCESWENADDLVQPNEFTVRFDAEEELRYLKRKYVAKFRIRAVEDET